MFCSQQSFTRNLMYNRTVLTGISILLILTDLAGGSSFAKRTSASLFVSAVKHACAFTALSNAQTRRACDSGCLSFDVLYKPYTILGIHFIGIDKRQSNISFELFDLIRYRIVSYEIHKNIIIHQYMTIYNRYNRVIHQACSFLFLTTQFFKI